MDAAVHVRAKDRGRGVLEGAFALLEALRQHGDEAGVTELAVACGVPKSTAHRLLEQLVALDRVVKSKPLLENDFSC